MVLLGSFVAQSRGILFYDLPSSGARVGDNVVFVRESGNLYDPSCVQVHLLQGNCVYIFGRLKARVVSTQLLHDICDVTMSRC